MRSLGKLRGCRGRGLGPVQLRHVGLDRLALGTGQGLLAVVQQALRRLVARGEAGDVLGFLAQQALAVLQHMRRLVRGVRGLGQLVRMAFAGLGEFLLLPFQPLDRLARITIEAALALDIPGQLFDPAHQGLDLLARALFLILQGVALDRDALEHGGGDGLLLAQGRQGLFGGGAGLDRLLGQRLGAGRGGGALAQRLLGGGAGLVGVAPAAIEQHAFGLAQRLADLAVAGGLAGLSGQLGQLLGELFQHVVDAGQVALGAVELQLGLVPALVEARDAGGLFEDAAAGLRLGVDQLGDLALPHESGRMRAGGGIGEQHLDVAGAHVLGVGLVGRADVAGDAADDLQLVLIVEPGRREAFGVVEDQRHLGKVAGRAGGGPGKDHVFHAAAAHGGRAVLAHDPAQRFEQVGLATAVRADHAGQTIGDDQIGGVNEALEPGQSEFGETQGCGWSLDSGLPFRLGREGPASQGCAAVSGIWHRVIHKMLRILAGEPA